MSWASENKFLTGFGIVVAAGLGTLGYLTFAAMGGYDEATAALQMAAGDLKIAHATRPHESTLKALVKQKEDLSAAIKGLQSELKTRVPVVEPVTKAEFQDRLKNSVARVTARSSEVGVKFPQGFYLGCEAYKSGPPTDAAATPLARQLGMIESVVDILLQTGGIEVQELKRDPISEEQEPARTPAPPPTPAKGQAGKDKPAPKLVHKTSFNIKFASTDAALRQVLNAIVGHKEHFYVVRNIELHNERPDPPAKTALALAKPGQMPPTAPGFVDPTLTPGAVPAPVVPAPAVPAPAPETPAAPAPGGPERPALAYIFGTERVIATLQIESLDFTTPEAPAKTEGKAKNN